MSKEAHAVLTWEFEGLQIVGSYHRMEMKTHYKKLKNSLYGDYLHTQYSNVEKNIVRVYISSSNFVCLT
ncbi:hypothetical protein C8R48DRAFT_733454 [Suillus tomentosus]|nr:hypothetical protein C8R48DRAFT_733454 [Suillus tomentosus]